MSAASHGSHAEVHIWSQWEKRMKYWVWCSRSLFSSDTDHKKPYGYIMCLMWTEINWCGHVKTKLPKHCVYKCFNATLTYAAPAIIQQTTVTRRRSQRPPLPCDRGGPVLLGWLWIMTTVSSTAAAMWTRFYKHLLGIVVFFCFFFCNN